jgi:hypothetical protein
MDAVVALAPASGLTAGACTALNVSRASIYRRRAEHASHQTKPAARTVRRGTHHHVGIGLMTPDRLRRVRQKMAVASATDITSGPARS